MTEEQAAKLIEQNRLLLEQNARLLEENAALRSGLQQQKDLVAALLKRIYGPKSDWLSHDQLLMAFLEDERKKPDAAGPDDLGPAAEDQRKVPRAKRTNKLAYSLKGLLPTTERIVVSAEVLAEP